MSRENAAAEDSFVRDPGKIARNNSYAFLDGDDLVDGHIRQFIHLTARPSDLQRLDLRSLAQTKMNARITRRHVAHAALGLLDVRDALGSQLKGSTDAIAIGVCADEQNFQPMPAVAPIVTQRPWTVADVGNGDVDANV